MTAEYVPQLIPEDDPDVRELHEDIVRHRITHVRDQQGRVFKIFGHLNRKSVPLNHAVPRLPSRIPFPQVEDFGIMIDPGSGK